MTPLDRFAAPSNQTGRKRGSVLVLGYDDRAFLTAIRSFGRAGFDVDVGWHDESQPVALASRFIRQRQQISPCHPGETRWLDELNALVARENYCFVLPCHDRQVLPLQQHRARLARSEVFALVPDSAFRTASDKAALHELALSLGVPVPEQHVAHSRAEILALGQELQFPLYAKPPRSTRPEQVSVRREVRRISSAQEIVGLSEEELAEGYLIQRRVNGRGVGVDLLACDGKILTALQHERLHEPPAGGGSSYRRSVPMDASLLSYSSSLMRELNYTGAAMVEFKVEGDRPYLMEINARLWGSLALTVAAGLDIPLFWYEMLREGRRQFPQQYRTGVHCRHWTGERHWITANLRALRSTSPGLITTPVGRVAYELLNIPSGREASDTFAFDDAKPAFVEAAELVRGLLGPRLARSPLGVALHRRRTKARVRAAGSILFVCYGNICRSPYAEVLASQRLDAVVASAGVHPTVDRPSPTGAVQAAAATGVNLSRHRSRTLTRDMTSAADVIFVFDRNNERDVLALDPTSKDKIVYLGAYAGRLEIADPYGQPVERFATCYREINRALLAIAALRRQRAIVQKAQVAR